MIDIKSPLTDAASDVLESMYFVSVLGCSSDPVKPDSNWIWSRLNFSGNGAGSFGIGTSSVMARIIAENFLGQATEEITQAQIEEVLCELSNMICGSFLSRYRTEALFDLAHPLCEKTLAAIPAGATTQTFELGEGVLHLWLEFAA